jgi:sulfite reductase alpha subunit-like flavoprotein
MGIGDACDEDGWETGYSTWLPDALKALGVPDEKETAGPPEASFTVEVHRSPALTPPKLCPPGAVLARVEENAKLAPEDYERDIRHFVIKNTGDVDLPFNLGDAVGLYPENLPEDVERALKLFGFEPDQPLSLACTDETASDRLKNLGRQRTTARQIFTEVLDIFGRPSRSFYKALSKFADEREAKLLMEVFTGARFKELAETSITYFEVFEKFPSARPSMAHLLGLVPAMKWRLYSIANSADYSPGVIELTVVINQWDTQNPKDKSNKVKKTGVSTKYIQQLQVGQRIAATMTNGTFTFPQDDKTPMIMAGLGTGIAPIRSFVQDRMYKKQVLGKEVGPMVVFYGCRHEREEFFYKEEWKKYQEAGVLTKLVNAFSHDKPHYPPKMIFVNQRMEENPELLGDLIGKEGGYFYMCGLAVAVPGIDTALKKAMIKAGTVTEKDADAWLEEMKATGRYSQESY